MKPGHLPTPTIRRLSLYLRQLETALASDRHTLSSKQIGRALGLTDAQVRKDLAYFGQFGQPGVGYRVEELAERLRHILGTDKTWPVALVGAGNLGRALLAYRNFERKGFRLAAAFDTDPQKVGQRVPALERMTVQPLQDLAETVERLSIRLGVICVPASAAQPVADRLVEAGIRGLLNFAPVALTVPEEVAVVGADLALHLEQLAFQVGGTQGPAVPR